MFVTTTQMRSALHFVPEKLQLAQLWNGNLQCFSDSAKASISRTLRSPSHLLKKIGTERVRCPAQITIRFPHKLGNQMEVSDRLKELGKLSEFAVDVNLLEMRLVQTVAVFLILWLRTLK